MMPEYDLTKAVRGKFYHPDVAYRFPVYLEPDVNDFLSHLAEHKKIDVQELVNNLLRADIRLIETVQ